MNPWPRFVDWKGTAGCGGLDAGELETASFKKPQEKSGRIGIRTQGTLARSPVFKTGAFDQTQPSVLRIRVYEEL